MRLTCEHLKIAQAVEAVQHIVVTKSTLPIIGNILLEAASGKLRVSANNLEIGMEVSVPAEVSESGAVLVPAKTLASMVSRLPSGKIQIDVSGRGVVIFQFRKATMELRGMPPDEFPALPKIKGDRSLEIESELLGNMIEGTIFSASSGEDKHVLSGVLVEVVRNSITMVATDGYRLARKEAELTKKPGFDGGFIVPGKALAELHRVFDGDKEGKVKILFSDEQVAFQYKDAYIVSRQIHGQFPDYRQVIPKTGELSLTVSRKDFLEAVERAAVIAQGGSNVIRFEWQNGQFHIRASVPEVGSVDEVLDVKGRGSKESHIAFNVRLVLDVLKVMQTEEVVLELSGALAPGLIRPDGDAGYVYVVMPIRTAETVPA